ncbi:toll/interleukin-1 receptor domain-containing protein [Amycolatopsis sp. NPDC051061]|uniref:toll/interleukin-1 receptor domain-containing protein n=1 Tax=Amycolatopsis sp. NPDC051061 TaxID=3155042 RepID=UPI00343E2071
MTPPGVAVESRPGAHWAWAALLLRPATTLSRTLAYPEVDEQRWLAQLAVAERAWISGRWTTEQHARWELRFGSNDGEALSCVLLARTHGSDRDAVVTAAAALRDRLAAMPGHVVAEPVLDDGEVRRLLHHPGGTPQAAYEVRKRLRWAWRDPRETHRRVDAAITPLTAGATSWETVWHALAGQSAPTTVAVHLEPWSVPAQLTPHLTWLAGVYAGLAAGRSGNPIWNVGSPPDPFAREAAGRYSDAARRYTGRCFRLRVSIVSAGSLDPAFAELVAAATGGVVCPVAPAELPTVTRNLATLDRGWLELTHGQGAPAGELGEPARTLTDTVDAEEAPVAFRLPYELPGHLPLFTAPGRLDRVVLGGHEEAFTVSEPGQPPRKRVFVSYVQEDQDEVDRLVLGLREAGYDTWMDRDRLAPGMRWKSAIRDAILNGDSFVACFSPRYWKSRTYMNEELTIAVEQLRLMPRDRQWFMPVVFEDCELPDHPIGPGETIANSLQYADFSESWDKGFGQLVGALGPPS